MEDAILLVILGCPIGAGPEPMNKVPSVSPTGPCSWIPGSRAAPAPRNDGDPVFFHRW